MRVVIDAEQLTLDDLELMDALASGKLSGTTLIGKVGKLKSFFARFAMNDDGSAMDPAEAQAVVGQITIMKLAEYLGEAAGGLGIEVPLVSEKA